MMEEGGMIKDFVKGEDFLYIGDRDINKLQQYFTKERKLVILIPNDNLYNNLYLEGMTEFLDQ